MAVVVQLIGLIIMIGYGAIVSILSGDLGVSSFGIICFSILWTIIDIIVPLILKV
jgi:hypothetical protein